jgi:hypothetical protein
VFFVVDREHGIRGRNIGNVWISRRVFHKTAKLDNAMTPQNDKV